MAIRIFAEDFSVTEGETARIHLRKEGYRDLRWYGHPDGYDPTPHPDQEVSVEIKLDYLGNHGRYTNTQPRLANYAHHGNDYVEDIVFAKFQPGQTDAYAYIQTVDDHRWERTEQVWVNIGLYITGSEVFSSPNRFGNPAKLGDKAPGSSNGVLFTIYDNDTEETSSYSISPVEKVVEGSTSAVKISRTGGLDQQNIRIITNEITAKKGDVYGFSEYDYRGLDQELTFKEGEAEIAVPFETFQDQLQEGEESFELHSCRIIHM